MSRTYRGLLALLALAAVLVGANAAVATGGWVSAWRALNDFGITIADVRLSEDRQDIAVGLMLSNGSASALQIQEVITSVQLNGHRLADGRLASRRLTIAPQTAQVITVSNRLPTGERAAMDDRLARRPLRWDVSGRVRVTIVDVDQRTWVPYSGTLMEP